MPEGPEAKRMADVLNLFITGWLLVEVCCISDKPLLIDDYDQLMYRLPLVVERVYSVGKRVIIQLSGQVRIVVSLRMTGSFQIGSAVTPSRAVEESKAIAVTSSTISSSVAVSARASFILAEIGSHTRAVFKLTKSADDTSAAQLIYNDQRTMSQVSVFTTDREFNHWRSTELGWDPLNEPEKMDRGMFHRMLSTLRAVIVTVLSNQKLICGGGNYLRSEWCHRAKISPLRKANSLTRAESDRLYDAVVSIILEAYKAGGHTLGTYKDPLGRKGEYVPMVYDRAGKMSVDIRQLVKSRKVGGQTIFWCPVAVGE
jgi:formamidopyrimidine-DNA glycosylase